MSFPGIIRRLFANNGAGPKLRMEVGNWRCQMHRKAYVCAAGSYRHYQSCQVGMELPPHPYDGGLRPPASRPYCAYE